MESFGSFFDKSDAAMVLFDLIRHSGPLLPDFLKETAGFNLRRNLLKSQKRD